MGSHEALGQLKSQRLLPVPLERLLDRLLPPYSCVKYVLQNQQLMDHKKSNQPLGVVDIEGLRNQSKVNNECIASVKF